MTSGGSFDERVGANLRALREARGWSQGEFSRLLEERGVVLRQQVIAKIEAGQRPLRLNEAAAATELLEVPVEAVTASRERLTRGSVALHNVRLLTEYAGIVIEAGQHYVRTRQFLLAWLGQEQDQPLEERIEARILEEVSVTLEEWTPEDLVQTAVEPDRYVGNLRSQGPGDLRRWLRELGEEGPGDGEHPEA